MISILSRLYFWTPGSDDLLYMTELYTLTRILRRINTGSERKQSRSSLFSTRSQLNRCTIHSLWFWEVPEGWSQSLSELRYLQEVVLGCYEYGLPLSIPILVSDGRSGSTEFLMKCGEEYYLFYKNSSDLVHIKEPTESTTFSVSSVLGCTWASKLLLSIAYRNMVVQESSRSMSCPRAGPTKSVRSPADKPSSNMGYLVQLCYYLMTAVWMAHDYTWLLLKQRSITSGTLLLTTSHASKKLKDCNIFSTSWKILQGICRCHELNLDVFARATGEY